MIVTVVGARPNFMKAAPIHQAFREAGVDHEIVHTGQHYDEGMSKVFFQDLGMPQPIIDLEVGSGTHAEQTAAVMIGVERFFLLSSKLRVRHDIDCQRSAHDLRCGEALGDEREVPDDLITRLGDEDACGSCVSIDEFPIPEIRLPLLRVVVRESEGAQCQNRVAITHRSLAEKNRRAHRLEQSEVLSKK